MRRYAGLLALFLLFSGLARAETIVSEVGGTWVGPSGQDVSFVARLTQDEELARLRIWSGTPEAPPNVETAPDFDNGAIALAAFVTLQTLTVVETEQGPALEMVTEFTDEYAMGRIVLQLRPVEGTYRVLRYHYQDVLHDQGEGPLPYACEVDFVGGSVTEDGMKFSLSVDDEASKAASWTFSTAFDRGICSPG